MTPPLWLRALAYWPVRWPVMVMALVFGVVLGAVVAVVSILDLVIFGIHILGHATNIEEVSRVTTWLRVNLTRPVIDGAAAMPQRCAAWVKSLEAKYVGLE